MGRRCSELPGLWASVVKYPQVFCTKKCLYLDPLDVVQKGCKIPNRKRPCCKYMLLLTTEESKFGLAPEKEQRYKRLMDNRRKMKDEWEM